MADQAEQHKWTPAAVFRADAALIEKLRIELVAQREVVAAALELEKCPFCPLGKGRGGHFNDCPLAAVAVPEAEETPPGVDRIFGTCSKHGEYELPIAAVENGDV